ncbi:hypothetical protein AG0111_0g5847 [Alternaria gaisen]|uniref:Uncharacterized protein n=1 Tax=Alternaria gaisen TaxID=167740 RepID=A0ACB6FP01_9PLEO|nr:hypothetical protein AG0111_0g5847 [Alternaria gaisen]
MPLDRLIQAKKSVSDIFTRMSGAPIYLRSPKRNENDAPIYETPNPYSPGANSTVLDASDESPVRKGLMRSLRKQKLRSISSLRSLRSPTKTKQLDTPASPPADGPYTPKHRLNSSLVLNFEESPPDKPIFDLDRKDSITSSLRVHRSSPVPVPTSEKRNLQSSVDLSLIPFGTVPLSPAPIQRILELDQTGSPPSPTSILAYNPDQETMKSTASTKSALSDSLHGAGIYLDEPVVSHDDLELSHLLPDESLTKINNTEESRQSPACEEPSGVHRMEDSSTHKTDDEQICIRGSATNKALNAADVNKMIEKQAKVILDKGYHARTYRRADGRCRLKIKLLASDSEGGDDNAQYDNEIPFKLVGPQADRLVSELGSIVRENGMVFISDDKLDKAIAAGKLPAYLDIALDESNAMVVQSHLHSLTEVGKHDSTWGQHTGLYDGSGYGAGSSLRPVTGVTEMADVSSTSIPGAFSDNENEAPTIIRRLWEKTYRHGPDTDFLGQAIVGDAAISKAHEQPESHFKDYKPIQSMLDPRGNA